MWNSAKRSWESLKTSLEEAEEEAEEEEEEKKNHVVGQIFHQVEKCTKIFHP